MAMRNEIFKPDVPNKDRMADIPEMNEGRTPSERLRPAPMEPRGGHESRPVVPSG